MQISLGFSVKHDLELIEQNIVLPIIRLSCSIEFKLREDWSDLYHVIIDTGSPISVFPSYIQKECDTHFLHQTVISGLVPDEKCSLPAKLVSLAFRLSDKDKVTFPIYSKAYIVATDKIPLILGFVDILEKYDLFASYSRKKAYLVLPD